MSKEGASFIRAIPSLAETERKFFGTSALILEVLGKAL
jgi:hypothetical protein